MNPNLEEDFYCLMQQYRHTPVDKQQSVTKAYNEVLEFIDKAFEQKLNIAVEALETTQSVNEEYGYRQEWVDYALNKIKGEL